jgi:branched-subunit amino acid aminotransferase/4-amino-4-deoxychorismate lyase
MTGKLRFDKESFRKGVQLVVAPFKRSRGLIASNKTLNYLENILSREYARKQGGFDAIFLGDKNEVLETSACNIFMIKKGVLFTPPLELGILNGITRGLVIELCKRLWIKMKERRIYFDELFLADEVFITNSLIELVPVSWIEKRRLKGSRIITGLIQNAYQRLIQITS